MCEIYFHSQDQIKVTDTLKRAEAALIEDKVIQHRKQREEEFTRW